MVSNYVHICDKCGESSFDDLRMDSPGRNFPQQHNGEGHDVSSYLLDGRLYIGEKDGREWVVARGINTQGKKVNIGVDVSDIKIPLREISDIVRIASGFEKVDDAFYEEIAAQHADRLVQAAGSTF